MYNPTPTVKFFCQPEINFKEKDRGKVSQINADVRRLRSVRIISNWKIKSLMNSGL